MARNGAGTFAVLNPVLVRQLRSSSEVNEDFVDAGDEITNTLPLDGTVGMDTGAQFRAAIGSQIAPGISFADDRNVGFRRRAVNQMAWVAGGLDRAYVDASSNAFFLYAFDIAGNLHVNGALQGSTDLPAIEALDGTGLARRTAANTWSLDDGTFNIPILKDGRGNLLPTGVFADIRIPFAATLTGVTFVADAAGAAIVDIYKVAYSSYPGVAANSICGSNKPTLAAARTYEDVALNGWTTAITAGDCLRFNLDSVDATITAVQVTLKMKRFT